MILFDNSDVSELPKQDAVYPYGLYSELEINLFYLFWLSCDLTGLLQLANMFNIFLYVYFNIGCDTKNKS